MELTNRQIFLISYLLNQPDGVDGEHLSALAGISIRTLQKEVHDINDFLNGRAVIATVGKGCFAAIGFTDEVRELILEQTSDRQSLHMPQEKVNLILSALMFERSYISMEALALKLYMSKPAVFRAIDSNNAAKKTITVNKTRGLIVDLPEFSKRQFLTKVLDKDVAYLYMPGLKEKYEELDSLLREVLPPLFNLHKYRVSGEALRSFRRYLIITVLRSENGYALEQLDRGLKESALMLRILGALKLHGIEFSPYEIQDCQAKLNELSCFITDLPHHRLDWLDELNPAFISFVESVRSRWGLELNFSEEDRRRFLVHIHKLRQRIDAGHYYSNYLKREINRMYPVSTVLVLEEFERAFGYALPEAEVAFLSMYIATAAQSTPKTDCVIVTSKHPSVVYPMQRWLESNFSDSIGKISIIEHYNFKASDIPLDTLILTTGESVVLSCPRAVLIKPLQISSERGIISTLLDAISDEKLENSREAALEKFYAGVKALDTSKTKSMDEALRMVGLAASGIDDYEFVLDTNAFLVPVIDNSSDSESSITAYSFSKPVPFRGVDIKNLVVANICPSSFAFSCELPQFSLALRSVLKPSFL